MRNGRGNHNTRFQLHHANTQAPLNEQAGTAFSVQPLATHNIDSLLNNLRIFIMSNANQNNANRNLSQPQDGREQIDAAAASMNSFPGGFHAPSRAAFTRLPQLTATTPRNRLKTPRRLSRSSQAQRRSTRRLKFKPNSPSRLSRRSWPSRRRLARCIAILPRSPTDHSVICSPRCPLQIDKCYPSRCQRKNGPAHRGAFLLQPMSHGQSSAGYIPPFSTASIRCGLCARSQ